MKICSDASYKIQLFGFQEIHSQDANFYKYKKGKQITHQHHNVTTASTMSRDLPEEAKFHTGQRKHLHTLQKALFYL